MDTRFLVLRGYSGCRLWGRSRGRTAVSRGITGCFPSPEGPGKGWVLDIVVGHGVGGMRYLERMGRDRGAAGTEGADLEGELNATGLLTGAHSRDRLLFRAFPFPAIIRQRMVTLHPF